MDVRTTENRARRPTTQHEHDIVDSLKIFFCYAYQYVCIDFLFPYFVCDFKYIVNSPGTTSTSKHPFETQLNFLDRYFSVMTEILISRMLTFLAECKTIMKCNVKIVVKQ